MKRCKLYKKEHMNEKMSKKKIIGRVKRLKWHWAGYVTRRWTCEVMERYLKNYKRKQKIEWTTDELNLKK